MKKISLSTVASYLSVLLGSVFLMPQRVGLNR